MSEATYYEVVNPSDAYTLDGTDFEAAAAATVFLGNGLYGLKTAEDDIKMPVLAFGGEKALVAYWEATFGHSFDAFMAMQDAKARVAAVLETVLIGSFGERRRMDAVLAAISSPKDRAKAQAVWHDERRTSMNDIGQRAAELAKRFRRQEREP